MRTGGSKLESPVFFSLLQCWKSCIGAGLKRMVLANAVFSVMLAAIVGALPLTIRVLTTEGNGQMTTKNELIAAVAEEAKLTKTAAAAAVDATFDIIAKALKQGEEVKLIGFGSFSVVTRAAREGRNPRTGKPVKISASKAPKFTPGKGLKEAVNE